MWELPAYLLEPLRQCHGWVVTLSYVCPLISSAEQNTLRDGVLWRAIQINKDAFQHHTGKLPSIVPVSRSMWVKNPTCYNVGKVYDIDNPWHMLTMKKKHTNTVTLCYDKSLKPDRHIRLPLTKSTTKTKTKSVKHSIHFNVCAMIKFMNALNCHFLS